MAIPKEVSLTIHQPGVEVIAKPLRWPQATAFVSAAYVLASFPEILSP